MSDDSNDPKIDGEVHRVGSFYAVHETPKNRPWEGATLHVWHKHGDSAIYVGRGNATQNNTGDELEDLIALLIECRKID